MGTFSKEHRDFGEGESGAYRPYQTLGLIGESSGFRCYRFEYVPAINHIAGGIVEHGPEQQVNNP